MKNSKNEFRKQQSVFVNCFKTLKDPRRTKNGNITYTLSDILFLVISAVISGSNDWTSIEIFGKSQLIWLKKYTSFEKTVPSHDTLGRLFASLEKEAFSKCFSEWTKEISKLTTGEVIAIDGKRIRGSYDTESAQSAIHVVSAFASQNGLCLGQVCCEQKSNEITAIPKLLDLIAVAGSTVTIDAMGCQTEIAGKIVERGGDYILAVKENQAELLEQVKKVLDLSTNTTTDVNTDMGHGRIEERKCLVTDDLRFFDVKDKWEGIKSVIKIESQRITKISGEVQNEERYYISSLAADAEFINKAVRNHWSIENNLHWMLDVVFQEDNSRKRQGDSAANFNLIAKTALALLAKEDTHKLSLKGKRYRAALDNKFREKIMKS